jgi:hypothetical protein
MKVDLSIPYDAAALLAYRKMLGISTSATIDLDDLAEFKPLYEESAVADVIAKRKQRELQAAQEVAQAKAAELKNFVASKVKTI